MDSTTLNSEQKPPKQACDNCRRRKIKCSRELPCDKCRRLLLSCSYSDVLRRKGPKFRTVYPLASIHPLVSRQHDEPSDQQAYPTDRDLLKDPSGFRLSAPGSSAFCGADDQHVSHEFADSLYQLPPPELISPPESTGSPPGPSAPSESVSSRVLPCARRLTPPVLLAHVNVYLKYLFPIMPVVRSEQLHLDSHQPQRLSPQRYAFMASLCAATHIQLKLDGTTPAPDPSYLQTAIDGHSVMSGEELLSEAVRARAECDIVEDVNLESLLTSFFLFAAYGNLDRQKHAWFYLCQAVSMAFSLGIHRESTYSDLNIEDAEEKRRIFWLLFVTERGYSLQQSKPVMLRSSIQKPQVLCSNDPILSYGFINLINIFEKLTVNLYDWVSAGGGDSCLETPPTSSIQSSLCKPVSVDGVLEIQQVDILITQQWLQAMMWKLSIGHATQASSRGSILPFHLPVLVGKAVMNVIGSASQGAVDAHGIGMEQKLYDLGTTVADVTHSMDPKASHRLSESTVEPHDLLWGILHTLDRIRGSQSYLFPTLLDKCKNVLGFDCTITTGNYLPPLSVSDSEESWMGGENSNSNPCNIVQDDSIDIDDPIDVDVDVDVGVEIDIDSDEHHHHHHHHIPPPGSIPPIPPDLAFHDPGQIPLS